MTDKSAPAVPPAEEVALNEKWLSKIRIRFPKAKISKFVDATQDLAFEIPSVPPGRASGVTLNPVCCAIGRALKAQHGTVGVLVQRSRVLVVRGGTCIRYVVSRTLRREIDAFDKCGRFKCGRYYLSAPGRWERMDAPREESAVRTVRRRLAGEHQTKTREPRGMRQW